ncbi:MAG: ATP-binding cassette domain-containing protein [Acidobacteria bacterium]|nr:ATP-binding cassette domain-containing protein [Acidobacteriota bacterium]NIM60887.1 ATP-binding cassette domain-containing protein [Acidobacteriota bacterium]NIO60421.1 ATP-binding cassette domain-containing protein [Acidobacteriota bacterium]NIQ31516.1 ATP-binding cassette domain-containing protein [Acidobacteriota bacterium]NIQ86752.1 ATP-binding cassette domain-containing protein [Acidobacteriota bacterium]
MSAAALQFERVTRRFGSKTAVDGLDLHVEPGSILGLVGRNGSGKTTSLALAHGILHADEGAIRVLGLDPRTDGLTLRTRVSLLAEESSLYPWMTVQEILDFGAALHENWDAELATDVCDRLKLERRQRIRHLSRGTRAKVSLALAVSVRPQLLLLDDPTAGLDPLVRREVLQGVLEAVSDEGGAVVYASHLVHDIERVADDVVFLDDGKKRFEASVEHLKGTMRRARAVFENGAPDGFQLDGKVDAQTDGRVLTVVAEDPAQDLDSRLRSLGASEVEVEPLSLEEILIAYLRTQPEAEVAHV